MLKSYAIANLKICDRCPADILSSKGLSVAAQQVWIANKLIFVQ
nr:hypothetical protein [Leptolyngbya sp. FACHB-8]